VQSTLAGKLIMQPQVNEVWRTKSGRLAIIVEATNKIDSDKKEKQPELCMLWYDEIDETLTVSQIMDRLESKTDLKPSYVFWVWATWYKI
jgi:hypothetical protein